LSDAMTREGDTPNVAATLDAGEQNCATLILNVRLSMQSLAPGEVLEVIAYDPSARLDLEAWTRMTGNSFLEMIDHEEFTACYLRKGET
jgi:tRNA 2-thiouridine synthesizing protein A